MKRLVVFLALCLIPLSAFPCSAASEVSFSLDSVTCQKNRLTDLELHASGDTPLSAALFSFCYDTGMLEFRQASAPSGSVVAANDSGGTVKLCFLCPAGADAETGAPVLTLTFKTLCEGSAEVHYAVSDCVDSGVRQMNVGRCTAGAVSVEGSADNAAAKAEISPTKQGASSITTKSTAASHAVKNNDTTTAMNSVGTIAAAKRAEPPAALSLVILCASVAAVSAFMAVLLYQHKSKKDSVKTPEP